MKKIIIGFRIKVVLLFIVSNNLICCSQTEQHSLTNTFWVTDNEYDKVNSEFVSSMLLSIEDSTTTFKEFGTGLELFNSKYEIKEDFFYREKMKSPFMKILSFDDEIMIGWLNTGDTILFKRVSPQNLSGSYISNIIQNKTFTLKNSPNFNNQLLYFDDKEVLIFSKDIENKEFPDLTFHRKLYFMNNTNRIETIIIGNPRSPKLDFLEKRDLRMYDLIIGQIRKGESGDLEISTYMNQKIQTCILTKSEKKLKIDKLISGVWKRGDSELLNVSFMENKTLTISEKGKTRELVWEFDNSGHLIIMTDEFGEKFYAISNFDLSKNRIGFEFARGKFTDLINREN